MATYNISVRGTPVKPIIGSLTSSHLTCSTIYEVELSALNGEELEVLFDGEIPVTYSSYTVLLDLGAGYVTQGTNPFDFIYSGTAFLRVIMENDGFSGDTLGLTLTVTNNDTLETDQRSLTRISTGAPC